MLVLSALLALCCTTHADAAKRLDAETLWQMSRPSAATVSPDGRWIAFTLTRFDTTTNAADGDIWIMPSDGRSAARALTMGDSIDARPQFSPDSRRLAYLSRRGEEPAQIYVLELGGGEPQRLSQLPVAVKAMRWFPDGRRIAFEADTWPDLDADFTAVKQRADNLRADKTQARISDTRVLRYWDHYLTDGRVPHVFELDIASGKTRDLLPGFAALTGFEGFEWDLARDGGELAYSANSTTAPYKELNFDIYTVDLTTGERRNLTADNPGGDGGPRYAPSGRELLFGRTLRGDVGSDQSRLMYHPREGAARELAPQFDASKGNYAFAGAKRVVFTAENDGRVHLYRLPLGQRTPERIAEGGTFEGVDVAGALGTFVRHDFNHPPEVFRVDVELGRAERLTGFNDARVPEFGRVEELRYAGAEGDKVHTWLVYPPGHRAGRKLPLVVLAHGGPFSAWNDSFSFRWNPHVFAARGYLVALPNFHGSTGYGQGFADSILGNHGEKPAKDVLELLDTLVDRGEVDEARMGIAGGSYGGYLTALLIGLSDRFKVAVVHAGVFDLSAQFASDSHWERPASYGDAPWTNPISLDNWSPSRFVPRMNTPTLILHGEKDYRVPVTQGINLHGALTGKGVTSRIVIFPEENHWILKPQASLLWHREVMTWLDRHLAPTTADDTAP